MSTGLTAANLEAVLAPRLSAGDFVLNLQVTAAAMAGVIWVMRHPSRDVLEPDELPFDAIPALCRRYLGNLTGVYTDWTPLTGRGGCSTRTWTGTIPGSSRTFA